VHHRIRRDERDDYARTAASLANCADVASIQFGDAIWGGEDGDYLLDFLGALTVPAVATLHTVPLQPTDRQRAIIVELVESVRAAVVMSQAAVETLRSVYGIDRDLVEVIPYGVPDLPVLAPEAGKANVGLAGRDVIMGFGLLAPGKGYELLIEALPAIVAARPNATLVIVGATHPDVRSRDGEQYRLSLTNRAAKLKMTDHLKLVPEFVGRVELARWVQAADVFVTPAPKLEAMVSGTLAYAMAVGSAIVSTGYPYAREMLAGGRGVIVDPTARALGEAITSLLGDEPARLAMGALAHEHSRDAVWTKVGEAYQELHTRVASGGPIAVRGRQKVGALRG
jgi:glycosyltransferase involved in cell wall biosynthesis